MSTPEEVAEQTNLLLEQERQEKEMAQQRAERLAEQLDRLVLSQIGLFKNA